MPVIMYNPYTFIFTAVNKLMMQRREGNCVRCGRSTGRATLSLESFAYSTKRYGQSAQERRAIIKKNVRALPTREFCIVPRSLQHGERHHLAYFIYPIGNMSEAQEFRSLIVLAGLFTLVNALCVGASARTFLLRMDASVLNCR